MLTNVGSLEAVPSLTEADSLQVSLTVTNTGAKYTATDSVLLFLFDVYRRVTPEYKLLKRYVVSLFGLCLDIVTVIRVYPEFD